MTVCIGTVAAREKAIVMLADKASTIGTRTHAMQADTRVRKIVPIGRCGWYGLIAGDPTFAMDVIGEAKSKIETTPSICESSQAMMNCMKVAYQKCRETSLVDTVLTPNLLDKQLVVARPNTLLPLERTHYLQVVKDISEYSAGCSLLICGFDNARKPKPHIFSVSEPGVYANHDLLGYWAIGIGNQTAMSRLLSMDTSKNDELAKSLYGAFDAKVNAEIMQGVGFDWDAEILPSGRRKSVPVPGSIINLIDRVYSAFPRSPFDDANRSPKEWHNKLGKFTRKIFPKAKNPDVIYFTKKPHHSRR